MSRFKVKPSAVYLKTVAEIRKLAQAEGIENAHRAYAEATSEQYRRQYLKEQGLKPTAEHACINRLAGRRCIAGKTPCHIPGADHVSMWLKDGKPEVYISQPYHLSLKNMRALVELCDKHGLDANVSTRPSWHFPGAVLTIEIRKARMPKPPICKG